MSFLSGFFSRAAPLTEVSVAQALANSGLTDTQARTIIANSSSLSAGLISVGLLKTGVSVILGPITFDPIVTYSGNIYYFTARRSTNLANAESRTVIISGSNNYFPPATAFDFGGSFPTLTANFVAGSAIAQISVTSPLAQPE